MVNIEHQTHPNVDPQESWIEVDHASLNVAERTDIQDPVHSFFDTIVDPADERNVWLAPKPGVVVLETREMSPESVAYYLEVPDGKNTRLVVEFNYGSGNGNNYYTAALEQD